MKKYIVEGGIDFFSELYKEISNGNENQIDEDDSNKCLITGEELTSKFVKLNCGHKFNYIPLYNDLVNHRIKFNVLETKSTKLSDNEIRCPYCRSRQTELLPYYQELDLPKTLHVNMEYKTKKHCSPGSCEYLTENPGFNPLQPESDTNVKMIKCIRYHCGNMNYYFDKAKKETVYIGDHHYCYIHRKQIVSEHKKSVKEKFMEAKKKALQEKKEQMKEDKKKLAEEKKAKLKEEKMQAKLNAKMSAKKSDANANVVLGASTVVLENGGCIQILKTGPKKGTQCGCKIFNNNLCKRHSPKEKTEHPTDSVENNIEN